MTEIEEAAAFISEEVNRRLQKFVGTKITESQIDVIKHHAFNGLYEITRDMLEAYAEDIDVDDLKITTDEGVLRIEVTGQTLETLKELIKRAL